MPKQAQMTKWMLLIILCFLLAIAPLSTVFAQDDDGEAEATTEASTSEVEGEDHQDEDDETHDDDHDEDADHDDDSDSDHENGDDDDTHEDDGDHSDNGEANEDDDPPGLEILLLVTGLGAIVAVGMTTIARHSNS